MTGPANVPCNHYKLCLTLNTSVINGNRFSYTGLLKREIEIKSSMIAHKCVKQSKFSQTYIISSFLTYPKPIYIHTLEDISFDLTL